MSDSNFKENIRSDSFWLNTLFLVVFLIVSRLLDFFLFVLTVVQWLFRLFTGEGHASLGRFSQSLGIYYQQVVHFLTGCTREKPFPFMDWPVVESESETETETETEAEAEVAGAVDAEEETSEKAPETKAELPPIEYEAPSTSEGSDNPAEDDANNRTDAK